jgi:protein-L-isoaspartate(D-aspartate) O-methyltransferase (PCMT)
MGVLASNEGFLGDVTSFPSLRKEMVERDIAARGVRDELVLDAMRKVPHELFLPKDLREFAYEDTPTMKAFARPRVGLWRNDPRSADLEPELLPDVPLREANNCERPMRYSGQRKRLESAPPSWKRRSPPSEQTDETPGLGRDRRACHPDFFDSICKKRKSLLAPKIASGRAGRAWLPTSKGLQP